MKYSSKLYNYLQLFFIELAKKYSFTKALRLKRLQEEIIFIPFLNNEIFFE